MSAFNDPRLLRRSKPPDSSGAPACRLCGYDLRGLPEGAVCPECGAPRERRLKGKIDPQGSGLIKARPAEVRRFGLGFLLLGSVTLVSPATIALAFTTAHVATVVLLALGAVWALGVLILNIRPFTSGEDPPPEPTLAKWLRFGSLLTQWAWPAAAAATLLGLGPLVVWPLLSAAGFGLIPTLWAAGDALEWGGDDEGGSVARRLLFYSVFAVALAFAGLIIAILLSPIWQTMLPIAVLCAMGLALAVLYFKTTRALLNGASMSRWALIHQRNEAGRIERLRERHERERAEQAQRIAASESRHIGRRAGADRPVSVDDFRS